ncbi:MAG: hypothetical protein ACLP9L_30140 [Thermoguttaceae bacterium]
MQRYARTSRPFSWPLRPAPVSAVPSIILRVGFWGSAALKADHAIGIIRKCLAVPDRRAASHCSHRPSDTTALEALLPDR